jgi:hypothetical protein
MSWTEQPCIVTANGQSGDVRSQVCQKTDAINFIQSIASVASSPTGPFPGATFVLIQGYGDDQNTDSVIAGSWKNGKWTPIDTDLTENPYQSPAEDIWNFQANELRRMWQFYIIKDGIVSQNPCFSVVETYLWTQNQSGGKGTWQYLPTPGAELFKTLQWIPSA